MMHFIRPQLDRHIGITASIHPLQINALYVCHVAVPGQQDGARRLYGSPGEGCQSHQWHHQQDTEQTCA